MAEPLGSEEAPLTEDSHCWSVFISGVATTKNPEPLAHLRVQAHDRNAVRHLILVRGGRTKQTDRIVESYGESGGRIAHFVTGDEMLAIGYYIQLLELHELTRTTCTLALKMQCLICMPSTRRGGRNSTSDRRLRLLDRRS